MQLPFSHVIDCGTFLPPEVVFSGRAVSQRAPPVHFSGKRVSVRAQPSKSRFSQSCCILLQLPPAAFSLLKIILPLTGSNYKLISSEFLQLFLFFSCGPEIFKYCCNLSGNNTKIAANRITFVPRGTAHSLIPAALTKSKHGGSRQGPTRYYLIMDQHETNPRANGSIRHHEAQTRILTKACVCASREDNLETETLLAPSIVGNKLIPTS